MMQFLIADTFTDSLARLTGDEQKAAKTTAFDLQTNPASPGLSFHKLDKARDKNFWSVRVNLDIRIIVHRTGSSLMLCYVDHHDKAYAWAERRRLETHPKTGAAQLVEIRETVREIVVPMYVEAKAPARQVGPAKARVNKPPLFDRITDDDLLGYGVPRDWLSDVRQATEETLLGLVDHLPGEAAEALLELATGGSPRIAQAPPAASPFTHPDAQRRFRIMTDVEELQRALESPWDKWTVFLHPEQRQIVEREYTGPARVSGSAGTGKTIVALHRAAWLAKVHPDARILLTTYSDTLANALRIKLRRLLGNQPRLAERIDVHSLDAVADRLYSTTKGPPPVASREVIQTIIADVAATVPDHRFSAHFLLTEWEQVVDAWQLDSWDAYRDVARLGRKTRLPEARRQTLWAIFDRVRQELAIRKLLTQAQLFSELATSVGSRRQAPYDFVVVDEAQDLTIANLRFLAALGSHRPDALFYAGDLGQRIFQQAFSWKALGVDIRGRSRTLRVNYRTSHQIRCQADRLLGPTVADVDGNVEDRSDTVSVFNGPPPEIRCLQSEADEAETVGAWLAQRAEDGIQPHEMGVFVRSTAQLPRAQAALEKAGLPGRVLDDGLDGSPGHVSVCTMHLAKGLEFRSVAVMACDDEVIPLQERIEAIGDDADLREVYDTERHLLYLACTRARDQLLVTSVEPASEFLDDIQDDRPGHVQGARKGIRVE